MLLTPDPLTYLNIEDVHDPSVEGKHEDKALSVVVGERKYKSLDPSIVALS